jgi:CBS domain-containing protein
MNLNELSVSEIMNTDVKTVNEDKNIMSACKVMYKNKIGCVIVVTIKGDGTPVGIITERDVVRILSKQNPGLLHFALWKLMSKPLVTVEQSTPIGEAIRIMANKKIRRLLVKKNGKMIGILTQKDIFKVIYKNPNLLAEFYGENFSPDLKEIYQRFDQFRYYNLLPDL